MIGIYKITNIINNKVYIGQSENIKNRWVYHKSDLKHNRHHNRHLQGAWKKYGANNFQFDIIEECTSDKLNEREQYWIQYYQSYIPEKGYNLDLGGNGISGYKHTQEEIDKMRRIQSPNIILQFDLSFNLIKRWIGGSSQIRKELPATKESIDYRCNHKIKEMSPYKNSYWIYEDEYNNNDFSWDKYLNNEIIMVVYQPSKKDFKEPICRYDYNQKLIKQYNNANELEKDGFSIHIIRSLLGRKSHIKTYKKNIWCYGSYDFSDGYYDDILKYKFYPSTKRKPLLQIDPITMEVIKEFSSCTEATYYMHGASGNISKAATSNLTKMSQGYYWKYKE